MRVWFWAALLVIVLALAWAVSSTRGARPQPRPAGPPPVPVSSATAQLGDMPVYLDALGSVAPYYMVTIHTRVDGELMKVYFREGQFVRAGDVLAEIDPRPFQVQLEQAQGQMAHDEAALANARLDLARYQTLLPQEAIPKQQADTQAAVVQQDEAQLKTDQAAIDNARLQLTYCRVTAPISGRIGLRLVDPGNIVHVSDSTGLLVITQMQPITVLFTLPEDNLPAVLAKLRAGASLAIDAYNRDRSAKLSSGRLLTADNTIDANTGTLRLKGEFENREETLYPNQFVNVRLLLEIRRGQVIVPSAAIQRGSQGTFVYVVKPGQTVEVRLVTVSITEADKTSIERGLQAGEVVVTEGTDKLQPGSHVAVKR